MALTRAIAPILAATMTIGVSAAMGTAAWATIPPASTEEQSEEREEAVEELYRSSEVFQEISTDPETQIPPSLIQQSEGIIIVSNLGQGGFIIGGYQGDGLMVVRQADGTWSNPAFMTLGGASVGLQVGGRNSDVVLLVMDSDLIDDILDGDVDLGGSITGTAGPVGARVTDPSAAAGDILIYSRSEGLFGGIVAEGTNIDFDEERNEAFYGVEGVSAAQVFTNPPLTPIVNINVLEQALQAAVQ